MKLIPFFLLISIGCTAQQGIGVRTSPKYLGMNNDSPMLFGTTHPEPKYDTVPVIMLVGDTIMQNAAYSHCGWFVRGDTLMIPPNKWADSPEMNAFVWQVRGYEVTDKYDPFHGDCSGCVLYTKHIAYLDQNKKALSLFVWQTIKLNK
jgi:hypothetical protein